MKKYLLHFFCVLFIILCICVTSKAQINDDFGDGNFSENPIWQGDDSLWQINTNLQLQSNGTSGTAKDIYLTTQNSRINNTEWRFTIRFDFNPSTQNFCRYYLSSDQPNLKGGLNGYYIQFGGSTGNSDTISLYKQLSTTRTRIIAGRPGTVAKNSNLIDIKVTRDSIGNWQLYSDTLATGNFNLEGSIIDSTFKTSAYTGLFSRFTSSNISNFYFDNVYIGEPIIDITPPKIESLEFLNDSIIKLNFNENINADDVSNLANFELDNVFPLIVNTTIGSNFKSINIIFDASLINGNNYQLTIKNIQDNNHNLLLDTTVLFAFYQPTIDDIIVNEIMPDPSPSNGLPDAEYIELYNKSNFDINLNGWKIFDLTGSANIPQYTIKAKEYLIICSPANENLFKNYGNTLAVPFLQSLNNDGDLVKLVDNKNNIINQVKYDLSWYNSSLKSEGGWSLELINLHTLCKGIDNWNSSVKIDGGTPGKVNSIAINKPDTTRPSIKKWYYTSNKNLVLIFSEKMDSLTMQSLKLTINNNTIATKNIAGVKFDSVFFSLTDELIEQQTYMLHIDDAFDCSMNKITKNTAISFTYIPIKTSLQNDILITEIYANPKPNTILPNAEFIELYNRSKNIVLLNNFKIKSGSSITTIGSYQLYPDSFLVLCDDSKLGAFLSFKNVVAVATLPSLSLDDEVILLNENNTVIHQIAYKQTWYNDKVKADGGWSLEMIDTKNPCGTASNWTASKNISGGTIGMQNSVKGINEDKQSPSLLRIYPINANKLELIFSEPMKSSGFNLPSTIKINPAISGNYKSSFTDDFYTHLVIEFTDSIRNNEVYSLVINDALDCANNSSIEYSPLSFGLCKPADTADLAINEILFNPHSNGVDFVEIYNKTNQFLDIKNCWIGSRNEANEIDNFYALNENGYMLMPHSYYVVTTDATIIKQQYQVLNPKNFIVLNSLPTLSDNDGTILLFSKPQTIFDELKYDDKMHFTLIDNKEGVSLERIDFNKPINDRNNWTSAASTSGFATPTAKNSQYLNTNNKGQLLNIEPEVFTPNNDGTNDVVNFTYKFNKNNFMGTLQIYNSNGLLVKTLLNNLPLAAEGSIIWNGLGNKNEALPIGIYIAYFEFFNTDGTANSIKKTVVIGSGY